jgi:hypothetical protein
VKAAVDLKKQAAVGKSFRFTSRIGPLSCSRDVRRRIWDRAIHLVTSTATKDHGYSSGT